MAHTDGWIELIHREDWSQKAQSHGALAVYSNDEYIVEVWPYKTDWGQSIRLAVKRFDKRAIHRWSDLQRIKSEIVGPERTALEVYPADSELTDTANIYHLWVLPEGMKPPFMLVPPVAH